MRKLRIIEHISLDAAIQVSGDGGDFPYSDWTAPYRTPAGRDAMLAAHGERFDLLLEVFGDMRPRSELRLAALPDTRYANVPVSGQDPS